MRLQHYYHWFGEIILGLWRVYSMLGISSLNGTFASLPFPTRVLLPVCAYTRLWNDVSSFHIQFVEADLWRDPAGVNGPLMRAACPTVSIETSGLWKDLIVLDQTLVFTRAALVSRQAAHRQYVLKFVSLKIQLISFTALSAVDGLK